MSKINEEKQFNVTEESLAKILENYDIRDFKFEVFSLGIANSSVKIISHQKEYVLRIYQLGRKSNEQILFELKFQDYLREENFPIPKIYKNLNGQELSFIENDGRDWQIILMEFIDGKTKTEYTKDLLIELAQTQSRMHLSGIKFAKDIKTHEAVTELSNIFTSVENKALDQDKPSDGVYEFLQRAQAFHVKIDPDLPHGYIHLDLDFDGNVLIKDNHIVAILDFDDLSYSAVVVCLANTMWHILSTTHSWEVVGFYLKEYMKRRSLTKEELDFLTALMLFRNYVIGTVVFFIHKNYEETKEIAKLEKEILEVKFDV